MPQLTPHGFCLAWTPALLWLHVVSDAVIAASYYSIPVALGYFVLRRRDLAFSWVFQLFAVFILACGTTHLLEIWTLWHADYVLQGVLKAVTAVVSLLTAALLWPLIPKALLLPSPAALQQANDRLREVIAQKEAAVEALRRETGERQLAQDMLRQAQKMEAIGQLTGGMAHDFNNLLMVVQGNLDILRVRMPHEPMVQKHVDRALQSVSQGSVLTGQLLAFARRQPLSPVAFSLNDRIRSLSEIWLAMLGGSVRLHLDLADDLWVTQADPGQSESALLNLVINGRDAMPQGGALVIRTANVSLDATTAHDAAPGDYVALCVTDTGIGMTDEVRKLAFEPFFTTKPIGSSGLGLSQIYGFVRQSHGHVAIESAPGRGTTVTIYLRRASAGEEVRDAGASLKVA